MKLEDFTYDLPDELIAQEPLADRQSSRLLVLDKNNGDVRHTVFRNIVDYLDKGDCLVLNETRVIPARLLGTRTDTGGAIEFVLLRDMGEDNWEVMLRPGRRANPGVKYSFGNGELTAEIISRLEGGNRLVKFHYSGIFMQVLDKVGIVPLPPYIKKSLEDNERYQTVYALHSGSAAAPTAGLHFTEELLSLIEKKGVNIARLTLHVGLGTFRPVKTEIIEDHEMHKEFYNLSEKAADIINSSKKSGHKIVAVGTTSCRVLETVSDESGYVNAGSGWTGIFIYPGYKFKTVDMIITNFHLPGSTLIMLVSAFSGLGNIMKAYKCAIDNNYRFFSFGDAMLLK
jgi:S-adenosylmethionine:tRNA ribosyltransferase-isomerase